MENFTAYNPTKLYFGKQVVNQLGENCKKIGNRALLVYGKGSILRNGIYDEVVAQLKSAQIEIVEFSGIKPNPVHEDVDKATEIGIAEKIDFIVAVGGGSVIDSAKIMALTIANEVSAWQIMKGKVKPASAKPIVAVLTLAATGTEMNMAAVLQNHETKEKTGYVHPFIYPKESYLDPTYTLSVPENYTAFGIADLIIHTLESYFGYGQADLSDKFVVAIIQEALEAGIPLLNDLNKYEGRERIMWAATNALNGLTSYGRSFGDWGVHGIGHNLSLLYDTPHGATLTIALPAWLKVLKERIPARIISLGKALFNVDSTEETILNVESMFRSINCPVRLQEAGIETDKMDEIKKQMIDSKVNGMNYQFTDEERSKLVDFMFA